MDIVRCTGRSNTTGNFEVEVISARSECASRSKDDDVINQKATTYHVLQYAESTRAINNRFPCFLAGIGFAAQHA
ncbi:hypothetical protein S7A_19949 [Pantoea sp. Sc1]|nr:hypothetical protein S7A_19949 [Pantoea sp. Sc1]